MYNIGDKIFCNGCLGTIVEYLDNKLYLVNFGEAGNFRLFEDEMENADG